jgi:hypothetical protein
MRVLQAFDDDVELGIIELAQRLPKLAGKVQTAATRAASLLVAAQT